MLKLPVELIQEITQHLSSQDVINLQCTCKDMRSILIAQTWSHIDLNLSSLNKINQWSMNKYLGNHDQCCKKTAFYHQHNCKRMSYVRTNVDKNLNKFIKAVLRGDFDLAYEWVKVLTIKIPFALNETAPAENITVDQVDSLSKHQLIAFMVDKIIPMFYNLRLIEASVDMNTGAYPIVPKLMDKNVETNVKFDFLKSKIAADIPSMNFNNIKLLRMNCNYQSVDMNSFIGCYLPSTVERFDLVNYDQVDALRLQTFFSKADSLQSVALKWGNGVYNPTSVDWLPNSVTDLQMNHCEEPAYTNTIDALNVTSFKSYSKLGQVFRSIRFPNLQQLAVSGPVDDEQPLVQEVAKACDNSPMIEQLKCRRLRVDFVASLMKRTDLGIKSLIVQPGKRTRPIDFAEYCRLATQLTDDLNTLVINLRYLSQSEVVRFLRKVFIFCPSIKNVFIEHLILEPTEWLKKVSSEYIFDEYSRIRVDHCFEIDIDSFKSIHLAETCQDRIKACAVRESMALNHPVMC